MPEQEHRIDIDNEKRQAVIIGRRAAIISITAGLAMAIVAIAHKDYIIAGFGVASFGIGISALSTLRNI